MASSLARPRYWVSQFDLPHLAAPVLILVVALLIAYLPGRPIARQRTVPPAPERILPTTILAPTTGASLPAGHSGVVEGLAQPGSVVRLYWYDKALGEPTMVGPDGTWRFAVGNFPPGQHSLRASALVAGRYVWSGEVLFTIAAPAAAAPPKPKAAPASNTKPKPKTTKPAPPANTNKPR